MNRYPFICLPTSLHRLDRLSDILGVDLWIKRDDLTGFALGGNKGRKVENLIAAAIDANATVVVTCGAMQSNFIRQLGAACSVAGIRCVAAVMSMPFEGEHPMQAGIGDVGGNVLLGELVGVEPRVWADGTWDELYEHTEEVAKELEAAGEVVYRIPVGGSAPISAFAFTMAGQEVTDQAGQFDAIVFASSSGSTQVGLATYFFGTGTRVIGIACDPEPELVKDFAKLSDGLVELTGGNALAPSDFEFVLGYVGDGYGIPSAKSHAAIELMARKEGIFLDPIYTGKAFAGLMDLVKKGEISGRILFWHTGGVPALFAR